MFNKFSTTMKGGFFIRPALLCSENLSAACARTLDTLGYNIVPLPPFTRLDAPVSRHADMLFCKIGDSLLVHDEYYSQNKSLLDSVGIEIKTTDEKIGPEYPSDILLNALVLGNLVIGRTDKISRYITEYAQRKLLVSQGYAHCAACVVSDNAIITSDPSVSRAASACGIDVLTISPGHIALDGYDCGFIGGASVMLKQGLAFFGNIRSHPDYDKIASFAAIHGILLISLSDEPLTDFGGALLID